MIHDSGKGFTLIELLVSVAVLALFAAAVAVGWSNTNARFELKTQAFKMLDVLNRARQLTVGSVGISSWGVHLEPSQYVLFKGTAYVFGDPNNAVFTLPSSVEISDISLAGGGADIVFDRLTGKTAQSGTFRVRLASDTGTFKTIEVLASGRTDMSELALPPANTRLTDTRHVHFTYNQSVSSAGSLTLTFPNGGPYAQVVDFQTYFSGGVFSWSGTVTVNGSPQVLRIVTHNTSGSSADFSVTRDGRYNTEALEVSLDGEQLVTYAANGAVSQGSSLWVTAPIAQ